MKLYFIDDDITLEGDKCVISPSKFSALADFKQSTSVPLSMLKHIQDES